MQVAIFSFAILVVFIAMLIQFQNTLNNPYFVPSDFYHGVLEN